MNKSVDMTVQITGKQEIRDNPEKQFYEQILSLARHTPGNYSGSMQKVKQLAGKIFEKNGLPGPKNEEYKYTDIVSSLKRTFHFNELTTGQEISDISHFRNHPIYKEKVYIAGTINGKMIPELSVLPDKSNGLTLLDIEKASNEFSEEIDPLFGQVADVKKDGYVSMNTMLTDRGVFLHVKKNTTLDRPLVFMNFIDSREDEMISHPHHVWSIGENSELKIIELYEDRGEHPAFLNSVTEITVEKYARFQYYKLQNFGAQNIHVDNTFIAAKEKTIINTYAFSFRGKIIRNNLNVALQQEHGEAHLSGLYVANNKSLIDNHTVVDHQVSDCFSNELYKGIMDDYSTGIFNGKIYVRPNAQKTNAFQTNHNILLSKTAKIDAKPQLEIWADDVKCTHGCTTGQINKEHLFYLRSRGISEDDARMLLLQAFASDLLNTVDIPFLKAKISALIKTRLHSKDN